MVQTGLSVTAGLCASPPTMMKREQRKRPANMRPCMCAPPVCPDALKQQRTILAKTRRSGWVGLDKSDNRRMAHSLYPRLAPLLWHEAVYYDANKPMSEAVRTMMRMDGEVAQETAAQADAG